MLRGSSQGPGVSGTREVPSNCQGKQIVVEHLGVLMTTNGRVRHVYIRGRAALILNQTALPPPVRVTRIARVGQYRMKLRLPSSTQVLQAGAAVEGSTFSNFTAYISGYCVEAP